MAQVEEKGKGNHDYTEDGTVDLKGRPVLRSKTGTWKACSFILGTNRISILFYLNGSFVLIMGVIFVSLKVMTCLRDWPSMELQQT